MEPLPEKLETIRNLVLARNVDEACHILGLLGYYRSFIPAFTNITFPITSLLKKNTPFIQSDKCQQALDYLKEIFCNKPLLQFPDPNKPYILYTDASKNAYSGILYQPVDSDWGITPVAYFSGTFTAQNRSWCATEKEAYAVLKSMQHFDYYLQGTKYTLHSDHKPLEPFLSRGMKIAKLDRWAMLLQDICPHKGKGQHPCQCYLQTLYTRYPWKGNRNSALTCSKDNHHEAGRHHWTHPAYRLSTTTAIPQHELHYSAGTTKTR